MIKKFLISTLCLLSYDLSVESYYEDDDIVSEYIALLTKDPQINIENTENDFAANPYFKFESSSPCESLWWQISTSEDFYLDSIISENVCDYAKTVEFSDKETMALNTNTAYYFRARGGRQDLFGYWYWGNWSDSFVFTHTEDFNANLHAARKVVRPPASVYERNPHVNEEIWNQLSPYFLPPESPIKETLDLIFNQKHRVLSSRKAMINAGFIMISHPKDKVIVARHPYLKGYLVKAYTDDMAAPDTYWWKKRIDGVNTIQQKINDYGFQGMMKTPKKWIYPLPAEPSPIKKNTHRKNFILVVEEMDILKRKKNLKAYKTQMNPALLSAFFLVVMDLKLIDSIYANNTPFCKDGRLAFIDTEHSLDSTRPVPVWVLGQYLSSEMYTYWEQLIVNGIPQ